MFELFIKLNKKICKEYRMFWRIYNYFFGSKNPDITYVETTPTAKTTDVIEIIDNKSEETQEKVSSSQKENFSAGKTTTNNFMIKKIAPIQQNTIEDYSTKTINFHGLKERGLICQNLIMDKFQLNKMRKYSNILIIGGKKTGKTTLIGHLMKSCKLDTGLAIGKDFFAIKSEINTEKLVFKDEYKPKTIETLINAMKIVKNNPDRALILDDCIYDPKPWGNMNELKWLVANNRFFRLNLLISSTGQYNIPPSCRANIDYIFLLNEPSSQKKKQLWHSFAQFIPSFPVFEHIMNKCTADWGCLVIDRTSNGNNKLEDTIFWLDSRL